LTAQVGADVNRDITIPIQFLWELLVMRRGSQAGLATGAAPAFFVAVRGKNRFSRRLAWSRSAGGWISKPGLDPGYPKPSDKSV
jgi:hypothetical protein